MARFSVPTASKLPSHLKVTSNNPLVVKKLNRLSRESLLSLALTWLEDSSFPHAYPHLKRRYRDPETGEEDDEEDDPDDLYPPCASVGEARDLYTDLQEQKGSKRDVVARICEGDWRDGLSLYQLAMVDMTYFEEHPSSQKWTAYQILSLENPPKEGEEDEEILKVDKKSLTIPRFHPSTFLQNLQTQSLPDVKAHYHFYRPKDYPILLLRIFVIDSAFNTGVALSNPDSTGAVANFESSRTVYIAFPDGSPSLFVSKPSNSGPTVHGETQSLQSLIVNGVPKALSRPRERFTLKAAGITSKNIHALLDKRGTSRGNAAGGGWSIYADERKRKSPLDSVLPSPPLSGSSSESEQGLKRYLPESEGERVIKKAKLIAEARFGQSASISDGKGVERFDVFLQDPFPASALGRAVLDDDGDDDDDAPRTGSNRKSGARKSAVEEALQDSTMEIDREGFQQPAGWTPSIQLTFHGPHVFAGIRQLVEAGIIDGQKMPGWMTGEEAVTTGAVRDGRIRGHKGSGL